MRRLYYASSQAGRIPIIGRFVLAIMLASQKIRPYYPKSDQSKPTWAMRYLRHLIHRRGLCAALRERVSASDGPVVHSFYATAVALDTAGDASRENFLLICDADFNRVWVPEDPRRSRINYLAPCTQVKRRRLAYGVKEESIFVTGFPLPLENIGSETGLEILKGDFIGRLRRLDPRRKFFLTTSSQSWAGWAAMSFLPAETPLFRSCSPLAAPEPRWRW